MGSEVFAAKLMEKEWLIASQVMGAQRGNREAAGAGVWEKGERVREVGRQGKQPRGENPVISTGR